MTHPDGLDKRDAAKLRGIRARDADLDRLTRYVRAFAAMMTGRHGDRLDAWITTVEQDTLPPQAAFATNMRRDLDAIHHGLTLPCSSGPAEGNINPAQDAQTPDVRPRQPAPAAKTRTPDPLTT
jgi:hypothetical protein